MSAKCNPLGGTHFDQRNKVAALLYVLHSSVVQWLACFYLAIQHHGQLSKLSCQFSTCWSVCIISLHRLLLCVLSANSAGVTAVLLQSSVCLVTQVELAAVEAGGVHWDMSLLWTCSAGPAQAGLLKLGWLQTRRRQDQQTYV